MSPIPLTSFSIDRDRLACLGLALPAPWILQLDGNVGLLHIGADIAGARKSLFDEGLLLDARPARCVANEHHPLIKVIRFLTTAPTRANLAVSTATSERQSYFFGDSADAAWVAGPAAQGSFDEFTIASFRPGSLRDELRSRCGLDATSDVASPEPAGGHWFTLSWTDLRTLKGHLIDGNTDEVMSVLLECGFDVATAGVFGSGLIAGANGFELNVLAIGGSGARVDSMAWNVTASGDWWLFEQDGELKETRFSMTSPAHVAGELSNAIEALV